MKRRMMMGKEKIKFPEEGLLHYWALNGNAVDSKGGANGTASGVSYVTGVNGSSALFGQGSYIQVPVSMELSEYAISFWMYLSSSFINGGIIFQRITASACGGLSFTNDGNPRFFINRNTDYVSARTPGITSMNRWYHVVVSNDTGNIKWYLNGSLDGESGIINLRFTGNAMIGRDNISGYNRSFLGRIDEMAIWNRALSKEEVQLLYNQGKGLFYE